jgi:putative ABC transport system permease protein
MIRNYLLIAYRNLIRQFSYSFINITGLAIGIACSLVIFLYVYGEWTHDKDFENGDRIHRISVSFFNMATFANGPEALFDFLPKEFEGIEAATRVQRDREVFIRAGNETYIEPVAYYTDSSFFHVFSYSFLAGDRKSALAYPKSIVLTESMARKYFKDNLALGKTIEIGKERTPYTVTGIVRDDSRRSHLQAAFWLSNESQLKHRPEWTSAAFYNYVLLRKNNTPSDLKRALDKIIEERIYPTGAGKTKTTLEEYIRNENSVKFFITSFQDIYLKSKFMFEISPGGNEDNLYVFSAIAGFILLLASVNFINLTTARASKRAKEVGIRKTLGTSRARLMSQFLVESILVSLVAMVLALFLAEVCLFLFEQLAGSRLPVSIWSSGYSVLLFLGFAITVGFFSGIYPAFYLTSFIPVKVLKGNLQSSGGGAFRNILVVVQFSVSICLIICTAIILQQLDFMKKKDLGFAQENVLTIDNAGVLGTAQDKFYGDLIQQAGVIRSSMHSGEPGSKAIVMIATYKTPEMDNDLTIGTYEGDYDYLSVMGYRLVKGRDFSRDLASDSASVILNESAVKSLGLGDNPIGAELNKEVKVIGVVQDFHWESLRSRIGPVVIRLGKIGYQMGFKLSNDKAASFLAVVEKKWKQYGADEPVKYHFLDDNFEGILAKEKIFGQALTFFTVLAILISCLGLYGLSAFTAEQRTKEIGIRKVLGATATSIVLMLNRNFTRLVLMSIAISIPASAYIASRWLEGFAYKMELNAWIFLISVAVAMIIAWVTVSYHSLKASWGNPAETLKYE